ncbi:MutT-like protein [Escovopsis weberi]|uniref:MutT-like protein n=1 Tax=Escovopsis weberi TaxID=150374 RepID=A0A0M8N676_ESCWE|nr:MutT-like protein [Escovopsis weberi]
MAPSTPTPTPTPGFPPALAAYAVPKQAWLRAHGKSFDGLACAALVFAGRGRGRRVLLVQRAQGDSMPGRWEVPGGAVDERDGSILAGCAREVWEETGLRVRRVYAVFVNTTGTKVICSFAFEVEVDGEAEDGDGEDGRDGGDGGYRVTLDPEEHQDWMWATEGEASDGRALDGREIRWSAALVRRRVLEGFRLRAEEEEEEDEDGAR